MAFQQVADLDCEGEPLRLGGKDKKTGKANPTTIQGYYIGSKTHETKFGPGKLHIFQTETGNVGVWGKTDMDSKLATVMAGALTRVTFTGSVPSNKGNDKLKFKVEVDTLDMIDVGTAGNTEAQGDNGDLTSDDSGDDTDLDSDPAPADEVVPARARPPRQAVAAPTATRQAEVQALLKGRRTG